MKSQAQRGTRVVGVVAMLGAVALAGSVGACAAKVEQPAEKGEVAAQEVQRSQHRHFRGPVATVIEMARAHGNLDAAQTETLAVIAREVEQDRADRRQLRDRLKMSAIRVLRSGTARSEEFEQSVGEAVSAIEEHVQRQGDALDEVHATLTPEQRTLVARALRAHVEEKLGARKESRKKRDGFKRFASHLMLSKLQIEQFQAIKRELVGEKQQLKPTREEIFALIDAFEGEDFRAALDALHAKKSKILRARVTDAGERTDSVLSIFTPAQRELLADLILEGPQKVLLGEPGDDAVEHARAQ